MRCRKEYVGIRWVGFKSRFGTYAEEICYVYDCPCGNHVAIYVITEQDIELTEDWSWDEGEHLEYRRTDEPHKLLPPIYIDPKDRSSKRSAELHIEHLKLQDIKNLESKRTVYIIHPERYKRLKVRL